MLGSFCRDARGQTWLQLWVLGLPQGPELGPLPGSLGDSGRLCAGLEVRLQEQSRVPRKVLAPNNCELALNTVGFLPSSFTSRPPTPAQFPLSLLTSQCSLTCGKTENLCLVKNRGNWQLFIEPSRGGGEANSMQLLL